MKKPETESLCKLKQGLHTRGRILIKRMYTEKVPFHLKVGNSWKVGERSDTVRRGVGVGNSWKVGERSDTVRRGVGVGNSWKEELDRKQLEGGLCEVFRGLRVLVSVFHTQARLN